MIYIRKVVKCLFYAYCLINTACTKEIEIDFPKETTPIITSIFSPNQPFTFYHSMSSPLSSDNIDTISPYQLKVYRNSLTILDTTLISPHYTSDIYPQVGYKYKLELIKKGYPTIWAEDSIPQSLPDITEAYRIYPTGSDEFGTIYCNISITFNDPVDEENYYEIIVTNKSGGINDSFVEFEPTDRAWKNEGDYSYYPSTIFFSDVLFNGQDYTFNHKFYNSGDIIILRSVSRAYYMYRKYYTRHAYNQQYQSDVLDVFLKGEPQEMYSNIVNGYGNFASYQETNQELDIIKN